MKRMNKTLSLVLAVLMVVMLFPAPVFSAAETEPAPVGFSVGDTLAFGRYPQSRVTEAETYNALQNQTKTWRSYAYMASAGAQGDYMQYCDIDMDGDGTNDYRGVKFTKYRPLFVTHTASADPSESLQDESGYSINTVYYFRYEPVVWRVLDPATGLVTSEAIIDAQAFHNYFYDGYGDSAHAAYSNKWNVSSVRSWLNNGFYNLVFSNDEKSAVLTSTLSNKGYNNIYNYDNTQDKVFLLSYEEMLNTAYGFLASQPLADPARQARGTDYARCQGLGVESAGSAYAGNSSYRLRTGGIDCDDTCQVTGAGSITYDACGTTLTGIGIRPAVRVNLNAEALQQEEADPDVVCRIEYRYRDKDFKTSTNASEAGWTRRTDVTNPVITYGQWSAYQMDRIQESATREVSTAIFYRYYAFVCPWCGARDDLQGSCSGGCGYYLTEGNWVEKWSMTSYANSGSQAVSSYKRYTWSLGDGTKWYFSAGNLYDTAPGTMDASSSPAEVIKTFYSSRTKTTTYYYERWSEWSDWSTEKPPRDDNREIEYRNMPHDWDGGVVAPAASCTQPGVKTTTCTFCQKAYQEEIPPLGHDFLPEFTVDMAASCTVPGSKSRHCSRCAEKTDVTVIPARGHSWGEWESTAPTCTESGCDIRYCLHTEATDEYTACAAAETVNYAPTGHNYTGAARSLNDGTHQYLCRNGCASYGFEGTENQAEACSFGPWTVDAAPTCTEPGERHRSCSVCGYTETETLAVTEHTKGTAAIENTVAPRCQIPGSYDEVYYCADCGVELERTAKEIPALSHSWGEWTDAGDGANHVRECVLCRTAETAAHVWNAGAVTKAATCKEQGTKLFTCTVCDATKTEPIAVDPGNHADHGTKLVNAEAATCTGAGYTGDTACQGCGAVLMAGEDINPLGHDWDAWTDNGDGKHIRVCKRDASHTETAVHVWNDGVVTKAATCKEQGTKLFTCTVCDATKTEPIAIDPNNHADYGTKLVNVEAATCTGAGYTGDTACRGCGAVLTSGEALAPLGHDWGVWTDAGDGDNHVRECARCHVTEAESHGWSAWTDTGDGTHSRECGGCHLTATENHLWNGGEVTKEATFDAPGTITYTCTAVGCGAVYTKPIPQLIANKDNKDVITDKTADYDPATGEALITLTASSKGNAINTKTYTPLDIVLVLDQSGSMGYLMNKDERPKASQLDRNRKTALQNAANAFIGKIHGDSLLGMDHRISVVGFAMGNRGAKASDEFGNSRQLDKYANTAVLSLAQPKQYDPSPAATAAMNEAYQASLVSVNTGGAVNPILQNAIGSLTACGATAADLGLTMACKVFEQNPAEGRKRVVVFMTDGEPTYLSGYDGSVANSAVKIAGLLKDIYHADVYSIGVGSSLTEAATTFLKNVCSNPADHYAAVTDAQALIDQFTGIAEGATTYTTEFDHVTLVDTLSPAFTLTDLQEEALRRDAAEQFGVAADQVSVLRQEDGTTCIRISDIHPKEETKDDGKWFTVRFSFRASANEKALEGGEYETNTANAGVMIGDDPRFEQVFISPKVVVEQAEGVIRFMLNEQLYAIVRVHTGTAPASPEMTLTGVASFSGWQIPDPLPYDENNVATVTATCQRERHTVTWNTGTGTRTDTYYAGEPIQAPAVPRFADGKLFTGWDGAVPALMPAQNLTFTAQFAPHTAHRFDEGRVRREASCSAEGERVYTCTECGFEAAEPIGRLSHHWTAFAVVGEDMATDYSYVMCENCGTSLAASLSFAAVSVAYNQAKLELSLRDANNGYVSLNGDSITLTLSIPNAMNLFGRMYVYRQEENGTATRLNATLSSSAPTVTFTTDHFSIYLLRTEPLCGDTGVHPDVDGNGVCDDCERDIASIEGEQQNNLCVCGKRHTGPFAGLIRFFHRIIYFFKNLFGRN